MTQTIWAIKPAAAAQASDISHPLAPPDAVAAEPSPIGRNFTGAGIGRWCFNSQRAHLQSGDRAAVAERRDGCRRQCLRLRQWRDRLGHFCDRDRCSQQCHRRARDRDRCIQRLPPANSRQRPASSAARSASLRPRPANAARAIATGDRVRPRPVPNSLRGRRFRDRDRHGQLRDLQFRDCDWLVQLGYRLIFATATGQYSIANGATASAYGQGSYATGAATTAIGQGSTATATGATAVGSSALATATGAVAVCNNSAATGVYAYRDRQWRDRHRLGRGRRRGFSPPTAAPRSVTSRRQPVPIPPPSAPTVTATFANSTAIGNGATTTAANQISIGTSSNTYRMSGITSAASLAAQVRSYIACHHGCYW